MQSTKRFAAFLLIIAMVLYLAGCQKEEEKEETPAEKYSRAQTFMSRNQFEEAAAVFDELGSYEESTKLSMYCKAAAAGENGDYDTAISTFELLGDYKESQFMLTYYNARFDESRAASGITVVDIVGSMMPAIRQYDQLLLFRDSKERAEACRKWLYDWAVRAAEKENYSDAIRVLNDLGDYSDAARLSKYYSACGLMDAEYYVEAADIFSRLSGYRDSEDKLEQIRTAAVVPNLISMSYPDAMEQILNASDYKITVRRVAGDGPADLIVDQDPKPYAFFSKDRSLTLYITGESVEVPGESTQTDPLNEDVFSTYGL